MEFRTVYDVLDAVRERPGMYGIDGRSLRSLNVFVAGLSCGNLDPGTPSAWDFPLWASVRGNRVGTSMPLEWLREGRSDEEAYDAYFRLLDEFRRCREVELARVPGPILRPTFWLLDREGRRHPPPVPRAIFLGRFAPSDVYYLGEVYDHRVEKLYPSFHATPDGVIEEARKRWSVPPEAWGG